VVRWQTWIVLLVRNVRLWHIADIRGTATFCPLLGKSGRAERVLAKVKSENLRRLFCSARSAQRVTPQSDVELVTEKQVFNFKLASRLELVGDEHCERVQDH
jgi:hypothetical protein